MRQSLDDLEALLVADPKNPQDTFLAAGSPWFLTLFGRDSLWAARMLLPLGTRLAGGTLRAPGIVCRGPARGPAWRSNAHETPGENRSAVRTCTLRRYRELRDL